MSRTLADIIDHTRYPLADPDAAEQLAADCRDAFDADGVICLDGFIRPDAVATLVAETAPLSAEAFFTASTHNVYLTPPDETLAESHVFNRQLTSSKGCICTDQVPPQCALHQLYDASNSAASSRRLSVRRNCIPMRTRCLRSMCTMLVRARS